MQLEFQGTSSGKSNYLTTTLDNLAIALSDDATGKYRSEYVLYHSENADYSTTRGANKNI